MGDSVWKGQISFGMVSFPVSVRTAARSQAIRFHQLHSRECPSRIKQVLYCRAEDQPVPRNELVKGFEYAPDRYAVVEERELRQIALPSSRVMEILEFVPTAEIDPVFLDASYYVAPQTGGEKPYALLFEALRRSNHIGLAQWTWHQREHLAVLRPGRSGLLVHTLFYHDEVRATQEYRTPTQMLSERELELAQLLVKALAASFEPAKYQDRYRESLHKLVDAKIALEANRTESVRPSPVPVRDILQVLKASLEQSQPPRKASRTGRKEAPPALARALPGR